MFLNKFMSIDTQLIHKHIHRMFNWLLPRCCVLCGYSGLNSHSFCDQCQIDLPILPHHCQQCAQFLPSSAADSLKCGSCLSLPPDFNLTYTLFPYKPPINHLITRLKFQQQLIYARALGELMTERIKTTWYRDRPLPDLIIPVPLHTGRLAERGFNQALEIARPIARALLIPLDYQGVKRIKPTLAQSGLSAEARKHNISQAFSLTGNYQGLTLALIDDVVTTGYTVRECSRLLKKNGAVHIDVWCCARNG